MDETIPKDLLRTILGREDSFLDEDFQRHAEALRHLLQSARLLVIGAAGSIGGAFVREVAQFELRGLHLVDLSENNLVEVVRDLRSSDAQVPSDFQTFAIDFTSSDLQHLLRAHSYDYILNFAALKHVRSERDPLTLMRLLQTNVVANDRLCRHLMEQREPPPVFCVSSDKAVRPANIMGASKAFMERVFLCHADHVAFTSARFANVAFSDGSLLHGFTQRLAKNQPISAPSDIQRYFITHQEAAQLCLLGCFVGSNREIVFPKFRGSGSALTFSEIAITYLDYLGYTPLLCASESEARDASRNRKPDDRHWPCFFSPSDTTGEKDLEEFVAPQESLNIDKYLQVGVVTEPTFYGPEAVREALERIESFQKGGIWTKADLLDAVLCAVPDLDHEERNRNLDLKM